MFYDLLFSDIVFENYSLSVVTRFGLVVTTIGLIVIGTRIHVTMQFWYLLQISGSNFIFFFKCGIFFMDLGSSFKYLV